MNFERILPVTKDVSWIGVLDPDIKTFDIVMETKFGTTYNSYFINASKKTLVEATKEKFWDVYLKKIKELTKPEKLEYIIVNHTEPDHSGNINNLLKIAPKLKIVGSGNTIRYLKDLLNVDFNFIEVKHGDVLDLGNKKIMFIGAPNLHWPDSMYSYLVEDKVLFTCDSFGAHYCHPEMYDDLVGDFDQAFKYYFDVILKPYSKFMLRAIERIKTLDISAICTGHGPLLTKYWKKYVNLSEQYATDAISHPKTERVFIGYVSAYQKTETMAKAIADGVKQFGNIEVDLCDIEKMSVEKIDMKITLASAIILGSPTINQNTLMQIYNVFAMINPLRDRGKLAGCFGSYGWSGESMKILEANMVNLKLNLFQGSVFIKFTPSEEDLKKCYEYGKAFALKMLDQKCAAENN